MTDFRALCVELTDCLEKSYWPNRYKMVFQQWTDIAHAALAEADGPAVSDDTETLRQKLIRCGWTSEFKVDTLVSLIEKHYLEKEKMPKFKHPIQLPDSIINKWLEDTDTLLSVQFQEAAEWGADAELDACCQWLDFTISASAAKELKAARRPDKKAQALTVLDKISDAIDEKDAAVLRSALES